MPREAHIVLNNSGFFVNLYEGVLNTDNQAKLFYLSHKYR